MRKEFIVECVKNNRKIDAIKYVRNETGLGLKQAVEYVEQIIEEYRDTSIMQQGCIFKDEELFEPAVELILAEGKITTAMLQRTFRIGYNRTAQLVDMLERQGIISAANGSKPRKALISKSEWLLLKYELSQGAKVGQVNLQKKPVVKVSASYVDEMSGHEFEYFCAELLQKNGFYDVSVTPGSGDQGVDVLASKDGIKYAIQCKNYASALSNTPVQEVAAGRQFYGCHVGVVLTNSTFTQGAIQLAAATNVLLWDRSKLEELISIAGGLKSFGIYTDDDILEDIEDESYEETVFDVDLGESYQEEVGTCLQNDEAKPAMNPTQTVDAVYYPRKGMRRAYKFCFGFSILCFVMFVISLATKDEVMMKMCASEGLFFAMFSMMFKVMSRTAKELPHVLIFGKRINKPIFVICCIVFAFCLFSFVSI